MDVISNALSKIMNDEIKRKKECSIYPVSKVLKKILDIMKENSFIRAYKEVEDSKGNYIKINLLGMINKTGSIRPNYFVKVKDYEKYEKRYLPAKDFGILIVSTTQGIMTHKEAKKRNLGGKLLAYCY